MVIRATFRKKKQKQYFVNNLVKWKNGASEWGRGMKVQGLLSNKWKMGSMLAGEACMTTLFTWVGKWDMEVP